MATTHDTATRIAIATQVLAALELGTVFPNARLLVYSSDSTLLASYAMALPAFPVPSAAATPSNTIAQAINSASGVPHHFEIADRNGVPRIFGAIGVMGSGLEIEAPADPLNPSQPAALVAGEPSQVTNVVYQAPP